MKGINNLIHRLDLAGILRDKRRNNHRKFAYEHANREAQGWGKYFIER